MSVAVVERWPLWRGLNKSKCVNCPPGQNKVAVVVERYVAVSGGSTLISRKKEYKMPIKITLGTDH